MKFTTLVCGLVGAAGILAAHTAVAQQHVTDEMLRTAQEDPNNWLMVTGNYTGNRFSKLGQINTDNVRNFPAVNTNLNVPGGMFAPQQGRST